MIFRKLTQMDSGLAELFEKEETRQEYNLEMIASESGQPKLALDLAWSMFNNKTVVNKDLTF